MTPASVKAVSKPTARNAYVRMKSKGKLLLCNANECSILPCLKCGLVLNRHQKPAPHWLLALHQHQNRLDEEKKVKYMSDLFSHTDRKDFYIVPTGVAGRYSTLYFVDFCWSGSFLSSYVTGGSILAQEKPSVMLCSSKCMMICPDSVSIC